MRLTLYEELRARVREGLIRRGMTARELSSLADMRPDDISHILSGRHPGVRTSTWERMLSILESDDDEDSGV